MALSSTICAAVDAADDRARHDGVVAELELRIIHGVQVDEQSIQAASPCWWPVVGWTRSTG